MIGNGLPGGPAKVETPGRSGAETFFPENASKDFRMGPVQAFMRRLSTIIPALPACLGMWLFAAMAGGLHASDEVRLGIVDRAGERDMTAVLTAVLSNEEDLVLLEREGMDAVIRERELAGLGLAEASVRAGRLIKAEAILLLERREVDGRGVLETSLIHVDLGFRLETTYTRLPLEDASEWTDGVRAMVHRAIPKLRVEREEAHLVSLIGLRSPLASAEGRRAEVNANLLLRHHLARHPNVFVLERWGLDLPETEHRFVGGESEPEYSLATALVEGEIRVGDGSVTIEAYIRGSVPGKGGRIELTGRAEALDEVVEEASSEIIGNLGLDYAASSWSRGDEAKRFAREARSAGYAEMWDEALEAALAARALGYDSAEAALLLLDLYLRRAFPVFPRSTDMISDYASAAIDPEQVRFSAILDSLDHVEFGIFGRRDLSAARRGTALARTILTGSRMLRFALENESGEEVARREEVRRRIVRLFREAGRLDEKVLLLETTASVYAPYWFRNDNEVLDLYASLLRRNIDERVYGIHAVRRALMINRDSRASLRGDRDRRAPWLLMKGGDEGRLAARERWLAFIRELEESDDFRERFDGRLLRYSTAIAEPESREVEVERMKKFMRDHWEALFRDAAGVAQVETFLLGEVAAGGLPERFRYELLMHYLETAPVASYGMLDGCLHFPHGFKERRHAEDLLQAVESFLSRLSDGSREPPTAGDFHQFSHRLLERFPDLAASGEKEPLRVSMNWPGHTGRRSWFRDLIFREGRLWTVGQERTFSYVIVSRDWEGGDERTVPVRIPSSDEAAFGRRPSLDVDSEGIAVAGRGWVGWYEFASGGWTHFEVPESEEPLVRLIGGELYYAFPSCPGSMVWRPEPSGILRIDRRTGKITVLASSRRRPAQGDLDDSDPYKVIDLFADRDGTVHASVADADRSRAAVYRFDSGSGWVETFSFPDREAAALYPVSVNSSVIFQPAHHRWHNAYTWNFEDPPEKIVPERGSRRVVEGATTAYFRERRLATRNGTEFWLLVERQQNHSSDLWLYYFSSGEADPVAIPLRLGDHERANVEWNARLIAADKGLVIDAGGEVRWLLPYEELDDWLQRHAGP